MNNKLIYLLLGLAFLNGCAPDMCADSNSIEVECYSPDLDFPIKYCRNDPAPPCNCVDDNGYDLTHLFHNDCEGEEVDQGPIPLGPYDSYYQIEGCNLFSTGVCPEYSKYLMEWGTTYYKSMNGRPAFFKFRIDDFDVDTYDYVFTIEYLGMIFSQTTYSKYSLGTVVYLSEEYCDLCGKEGTVKLDLSQIRGNYTTPSIKMYKKEHGDEDASLELMAEESFELSTNDYEGFGGIDRDFNITLVKNGSFDFQTYKINGNSLSHATELTFGEGANLDISYTTASTSPSEGFVDAGQNIILYSDGLGSGDDESIKKALGDWCDRLYKAKVGAEANKGMAIEFEDLVVYNRSTNQVDKNFVLFGDDYKWSGLTLRTIYNAWNYYNVSLVQRRRNAARTSGYTSVSEEDMSIATLLHEIGHQWSADAMDVMSATGCGKHTGKGKGVDYKRCLWLTECISDTDPQYTPMLLQKKEKPVFCEGHRQVFMNALCVH